MTLISGSGVESLGSLSGAEEDEPLALAAPAPAGAGLAADTLDGDAEEEVEPADILHQSIKLKWKTMAAGRKRESDIREEPEESEKQFEETEAVQELSAAVVPLLVAAFSVRRHTPKFNLESDLLRSDVHWLIVWCLGILEWQYFCLACVDSILFSGCSPFVPLLELFLVYDSIGCAAIPCISLAI